MSAHPGIDLIYALPMDLLSSRADLKQEVLDTVERFSATIGWHYLLDFVWLLDEVGSLPKGSVILDAGAGNGLMQMILAARGYKVLSVDFAPRNPPEQFRKSAQIVALEDKSFSNEYLDHLSETYKMSDSEIKQTASRFSPLAPLEANTADIVYWRADLTELSPLPDGCIDAIVSVSALEHNPPQGMSDCVQELERVLKPGCAMHVTISGSDRKDWFHEPSKGWCYAEESIAEHFALEQPQSNFNEADAIFSAIKKGDGLKEHLAKAYFASGNNGMPWGKWNPSYFPVGVRKWKP